MKRHTLKSKLLNYYSESTVRSILNGTRTPSYSGAKMLYEKHKIPMHIWGDGIKSYLNTTPNPHTTKTTQAKQ